MKITQIRRKWDRSQGKDIGLSHIRWLIEEVERLTAVVEWADENASFDKHGWVEWEKVKKNGVTE